MFPAGAPGIALLVLRNCIAVALSGSAFPAGWQHGAFLALLSLLCIGLLTPAACLLSAVAVLLDQASTRDLQTANLIVIVLATVSFAFLGPGAFSVDARLFGRRLLMSTSEENGPDT